MPLATVLLTILAQYGPQVYAQAVQIAHKTDPTPDDWDTLTRLLMKAEDIALKAVKETA
jgi:hypothetical protein